MTPFWVEFVGFTAAALTTFSFIPQAIKTFRSRDTQSISLGMYVIFTIGIACWLAYGVLLGSWPMIIANLITLSLAAAILSMKLRFG
ncbi:MAG: SemiSWEET transporter [Lysobacteraceae bacterium]